jgi:hypothetical protein
MKLATWLVMVMLLVNACSLPSAASLNITKDNASVFNHDILESLQAVDGEKTTPESARQVLEKLDLYEAIDSQLEPAAMITLRGQAMTLDQVWKLINSPDVNLDEVATVDGTSITLRDLKTMIAIEYEIKRIQNTYFNDVTLDEAHQQTLSSLHQQIATEGIKVYPQGTAPMATESSDLNFPSGIDQSIYVEVDVSPLIYDNNSGEQTITASLKDRQGNTLTQVPDYDISFDYRLLQGSAEFAYEFTGNLSGTVTFAAKSTATTQKITFRITDSIAMRHRPFEGQRAFLVQFYNPRNVAFQEGKRLIENVIKINSNYTFLPINDPFLNNSTSGYIALDYGSTVSFAYDRNVLKNELFDQKVFNEMEVQLSGETPFVGSPGNTSAYEFRPVIFGQNFGGVLTIKSINSIIDHRGTIELDDVVYDQLIYDNDNQIDVRFMHNNTNPWDHCNVTAQVGLSLSFIDTKNPYVKDFFRIDSKPWDVGKTFAYGQSIPICVTYSEPVDVSEATLQVNGMTLTPIEAGSHGVTSATFLYPVKQIDDPDLRISEPRGAKDLAGNLQVPSSNSVMESVTFKNIIQPQYKLDTFKKASASLMTGENQTMVCQVEINLNDNQDVTNWLVSEAGVNYDETVNKYRVPSIYASLDGGATKIDLYADNDITPTKLVGSFVPAFNDSAVTQSGVVEFYLDPVIHSSTNHQLLVGTYAAYTVKPVVFLAAEDLTISDNFPADGILFADQGSDWKLNYSVANAAATYQKADDFVWSSSDEAIAGITADGRITLTGKLGSVTFALTALNGQAAGKQVSLNSRPVDVKAGLTPYLLIPEQMNAITVKRGEDIQVRWTSNLPVKNAEEGRSTVFDVEVSTADYRAGTLQKGDSVYRSTVTSTQENPVSGCTIPAAHVSNISEMGRYSYITTITSPHPYDAAQTLTAVAYLSVVAKPAVVRLGKLDKYFITDRTTSVPISWTLENFDEVNAAEFVLEISQNDGKTPFYTQTSTESSGGSYELAIQAVDGGFKDLYTVAIKVRNKGDSAWSYDSFVLHVYSQDALQIWVDGADPGTDFTMSNLPTISAMSSEEILALKRDIKLRNEASINFGDHDWGQISDQIQWYSSDSRIGSLNYQQGGYYRNIEELIYSSYRPETKFALSGLHDGNTRLTVTHAATGLQRTLDVAVETLKDKLYLFQILPQAQTTLTYTNGNGEQRVTTTNARGELALYEESGIAGEIYLESAIEDRIYMGTLYKKLLSSEKDSTQMAMYPLNLFKLRECATVELYVRKPDGTPYRGEIFLNGGVYKNDRYCPTALLNKLPGDQSQTITAGNDGKITVRMNTSQFWNESNDEVLTGADKLNFIYLLSFPNDEYYPQIVNLDGNMGSEEVVMSGTGIVSLEMVAEGEKYKPFIAAQTITYETERDRRIDVRKFKGKIGPSDTHDKVILNTTVLWWGDSKDDPSDDRQLYFEDRYGMEFNNQTHTTDEYPFTDMVSSTNTFTLDRATVSEWSEPVQDLHLVYSHSGSTRYINQEMTFRAANMLDVPKAIDSDSLVITLQTISANAEAEAGSLSLADEMIGAGLKQLSQQGTGSLGEFFQMVIAPTADPTVYVALIALNLGGMANEDPQTGSELEYTPGFSDAMDIMKKKYITNQKKDFTKNLFSQSFSEKDFSFVFGGYMEAQVFYNFDREKWEVLVLNGGFNAGAGLDYTWNYNTLVGPIPVTAQLGVGASAEVIFKAAVQRGEIIKTTYDKDAVNDYLTTLRIYAYFKAFAGVGFDYSVVALKIGLFGRISLDAQFAWLNQPYAKSKKNGQSLTVNGQIGIEADAKFLFVSETYILTSRNFKIAGATYNDWEKIQTTWKEIGKGSNDNLDRLAVPESLIEEDLSLYPISAQSTLEDRDYLQQFQRSWASSQEFLQQSLDEENGMESLQTNTYPFANPLFSDDGQILVYVYDGDSNEIENTRVYWSSLTEGKYPQGVPLAAGLTSFGDSQLQLAGDENFAAAAWVAQSEIIPREAGQEISNADIALLSNGTEVVASVYDNRQWVTTRLSQNSTPDMAPAVAVNDSRVLVAWRSVYAADANHPLEFNGADNILYRMYDRENKTWSETKTLYNGSSGAVKALEASMLEDGTAALTYSLDTSADTAGSDHLLTVSDDGKKVSSGMEIVYAVIDPEGALGKNVRVSNDAFLDENPQLTAVTFDDDIERFVLGWYSIHDADGVSRNDIRLCAFDRYGSIYPDFIDSISSVNNHSNVNISSRFKFSKNAPTIDQLSILWKEPADTATTEGDTVKADKDSLKAVKFIKENGKIFITSALDVATMSDFTLIDHFDARCVDQDTVKTVILGTNYDNGYREHKIPIEVNGESTEQIIYLPVARSDLYTATAVYKNKMSVNHVAVDYRTIQPGLRIPVQFTLFNAGVQPIDNITIQIGDNITEFNQGLFLLPNESITLTATYDIPTAQVINPDYKITAHFSSMMPTLGKQYTIADTLYLDVPDVGIANTKIVGEENGQRVVQVTLYNNGAALAGSPRNVKIGLFSDPECTHLLQMVNGQEEGVPFSVDPGDFALIDAGAYTRQFIFDIAGHVTLGNEIPENGVQIFVKAWAEETLLTGDTAANLELIEYYRHNNISAVLFESLLVRNDYQPVTLSTQLHCEEGSSTVLVDLKNNALANRHSGNLIVSLLDKNGRIIDTKRSYNRFLLGAGLLNLSGEESSQSVFTFDSEGAAVMVTYADVNEEEENNTGLSSHFMQGIPLQLVEGQQEYYFETENLTSTFINIAAQDPDAVIKVNGLLTDLGSAVVDLYPGINKIIITVTSADGTNIDTYTVTVNNSMPQVPSQGGSQSGSAATIDTRTGISVTSEVKQGVRLFNIKTDNKVLAASGGRVNAVVPAEKAGPGTVAVRVYPDGREEIIPMALLGNGQMIIPASEPMTIKLQDNRPAFHDIQNHWGKDEILFVGARKLFTGIDNENFGPDMTMTRGMLVTVMGRLDNVNTDKYKGLGFEDVNPYTYYAPYIDWAQQAGIVKGTGDNRFAPDEAITREQLAVMLANYVAFSQLSLKNDMEFDRFADDEKISDYARDAIKIMHQAGIINGRNEHYIDPKNTATRAEVATMVTRLIRNAIKR